jgi:hypothetical protein
MQRIEMLNGRTQIFVFDLEFIGDVRELPTCRIWEIAVFSVSSNNWFEKVIDPDPAAETFPEPPIPEIPRLERSFLEENNTVLWPQAFQELTEWVTAQMRPGAIPVFVSHNTFRADKPILELECRRHGVRLPLNWYFFDSLHFSRSIIRNSTGNYSLSGLHEQLFNKPIENVHRARADVVACLNIMSNLTNNSWDGHWPDLSLVQHVLAVNTLGWTQSRRNSVCGGRQLCRIVFFSDRNKCKGRLFTIFDGRIEFCTQDYFTAIFK